MGDQGGLGNIDFSKLGAGLEGMGGAEGLAAGAGAGAEEGSVRLNQSRLLTTNTNYIAQDEEDMPELDEGDKKADGKSPKIQEVS